MKYKLTNLARGASAQSAREYDNTFCRYETLASSLNQDMTMSPRVLIDTSKTNKRVLINKYNIRLFRYGVGLLKKSMLWKTRHYRHCHQHRYSLNTWIHLLV